MEARYDTFKPTSSTVRGGGAPAAAASFEAEVLPHLDAVRRFAHRLTGSAPDADDLVQETYLRAFRARDSYTPGTRARSWLFTICRNAFVRQCQRERRQREVLAHAAGRDGAVDGEAPAAERPVLMGAPPAGPEQRMLERHVRRRVLQEIERIPSSFRDAVLLCDVQDVPYEVATRRLQVPLGTLKSRLFRGRRILRRALVDVV